MPIPSTSASPIAIPSPSQIDVMLNKLNTLLSEKKISKEQYDLFILFTPIEGAEFLRNQLQRIVLEESSTVTDPGFAWADGRRFVWRDIQNTMLYVYQLLRKAVEITNNDLETTQENTVPEEIEPPKLYAGKYQSVEALEKAYKNSSKVFNENKELQEKLKSFEAPENYSLPELLSSPEQEIQGLQNIVKTVGLNHEQLIKPCLR